ncbi:MAG: ligase-associated DNA damage response endonuclease PdeM [Phycisphaerales bacterium]
MRHGSHSNVVTATLAITHGGEAFHLLPEKAIWWPATHTLIVADLHLGKAAAFRHRGIPLPHGTTHATLTRLSCLIARYSPHNLLILGDLFHAQAGRTNEVEAQLQQWRAMHPLHITLVRGNHDRRAGDPLPALDITCECEPWLSRGFTFLHDPACNTTAAALAGHIHPVTSHRDRDGTRMRLPCFALIANTLILPAFGTFTGGWNMKPQHADDRIFAIAGDDAVIELPSYNSASSRLIRRY